jgi:hypothetical protein
MSCYSILLENVAENLQIGVSHGLKWSLIVGFSWRHQIATTKQRLGGVQTCMEKRTAKGADDGKKSRKGTKFAKNEGPKARIFNRKTRFEKC